MQRRSLRAIPLALLGLSVLAGCASEPERAERTGAPLAAELRTTIVHVLGMT